MKKQEKNNSKLIIITGVALVLVVCSFIGGRAIGYKQGFKAGEIARKEATDEHLRNLARLIEEKSKIKEGAEKTSKVSGNTITADSLGAIIEAVKELANNCSNEEAKNKINELLNATTEFNEIFQGQNNEEIERKFEELKTKIKEIEDAVNLIYDTNISHELKEIEKGDFKI